MTDFRRVHAEISIIVPEAKAIQCIVSIEVFKVYIVLLWLESKVLNMKKLNRENS